MANPYRAILNDVKAKDWTSANLRVMETLREKVTARIADERLNLHATLLHEADESGIDPESAIQQEGKDEHHCEMCGSTKDVSLVNGDTYLCKKCDVEESTQRPGTALKEESEHKTFGTFDTVKAGLPAGEWLLLGPDGTFQFYNSEIEAAAMVRILQGRGIKARVMKSPIRGYNVVLHESRRSKKSVINETNMPLHEVQRVYDETGDVSETELLCGVKGLKVNDQGQVVSYVSESREFRKDR